MPLPKPKKDESHDDFISRCMASDTMKEEYPDNDQRYAVCQSQWDNKKENAETKEIRSFVFEMELPVQMSLPNSQESRKLVGHAAVFSEVADIGGYFREQIEPGAFKKTIKGDDIRALFNHNADYVLGRNVAGTLKLSEDDRGLKIAIDPPDTQFARDLAVSIARGDINQMSFAFQATVEEWIMGEKNQLDLRKIKEVKLFDVSAVTYPAYEGTDIGVRSHELWIKRQEKPAEPPPPQVLFNPSLFYRRQLLRRYV